MNNERMTQNMESIESIREASRKNGELLKNKKMFIFDMDGTIYLGGKVFPAAVRFITRLRESGRRILFFTNNASHDPVFYIDKLTRLGFSPAREELMTSGDVTIGFLKSQRPGKSVYLVGTPELERQFVSSGITLSDGESADIVVTSFDTTLTYEKLSRACTLVRGGAEYLSTHPDFNCPTETGFIPDSGAIAAFVTASTGKTPKYFGKPYGETLEMITGLCGVRAEELCVFGDRLYTDIAFGVRHGVTAALVLTGETTEADVAAAEEKDRPDLIFADMSEAEKAVFG